MSSPDCRADLEAHQDTPSYAARQFLDAGGVRGALVRALHLNAL